MKLTITEVSPEQFNELITEGREPAVEPVAAEGGEAREAETWNDFSQMYKRAKERADEIGPWIERITELEAQLKASMQNVQLSIETTNEAMERALKAEAQLTSKDAAIEEAVRQRDEWAGLCKQAEAREADLAERHKKATRLVAKYRPILEVYAKEENWFRCDSTSEGGPKTDFLVYKDGRDVSGYEFARAALNPDAREEGEKQDG